MFLNFRFLNKFKTTSWIKEVVIQYKLKALGKVIHTGMVRKGMKYMYLFILLIIGLILVVDVDNTFSKVKEPPTIGRIPYGSGDDKSWNHKNPSDIIFGLIS
jgi:hypothetical protein